MRTTDSRNGIAVPFLLIVVAGAVLLASLDSTAPAAAQSTSMLGVDVNPDTNTPASLGSLETCASHNLGDEFALDIFVNNVTDLRSWELRFEYDEDILEVASVDYSHFLVSTPPSGNLFPTLKESEAPGRDFLAAAEATGGADSGSGVLARLTMSAVGTGTSPVRIVHSPQYFGPRLNTAFTGALGDSNGDGIWDASIIDSKVVVGGRCDNSPVVTPKPSPKPTPKASASPAPGETTAPTDAPGPGGPTGDGTATPTPTPGDIVLVPGGAGGGQTTGASDPDDPAGGPGPANNGGGNDSSSGNGNDEGSAGQPSGTEGDSGSNAGLLIVIGIAAAAFISLGGLLYTFSRRRSTL